MPSRVNASWVTAVTVTGVFSRSDSTRVAETRTVSSVVWASPVLVFFASSAVLDCASTGAAVQLISTAATAAARPVGRTALGCFFIIGSCLYGDSGRWPVQWLVQLPDQGEAGVFFPEYTVWLRTSGLAQALTLRM
ncbi:hypothetical protein D3C71_1120220 [compost metagenome]